MPEIKQEVLQHILLHLQDARLQLDIKDYRQVEHDIYSIGEHLGFSPAEVNADSIPKHSLPDYN